MLIFSWMLVDKQDISCSAKSPLLGRMRSDQVWWPCPTVKLTGEFEEWKRKKKEWCLTSWLHPQESLKKKEERMVLNFLTSSTGEQDAGRPDIQTETHSGWKAERGPQRIRWGGFWGGKDVVISVLVICNNLPHIMIIIVFIQCKILSGETILFAIVYRQTHRHPHTHIWSRCFSSV